MSKLQLFWLHVSALLTAITGAVFAVMKYFMNPIDEFSVINHPAQPYMLAAHVVVSPILLFILGWTFSNHMLPKFRFGEEKRGSGIAAMWLILPMAASGYLMQITTNESIRYAMELAHWISSAVFALVYVFHALARSAGEGQRA